MSFYETTPSDALRLGDVVRGVVFAAPCFKDAKDSPQRHFSVNIEHPSFTVILTPCCSIDRGEIVVAPLRPIRPSFLSNPYWTEDLTCLNRVMKPELMVSPKQWSKMTDKEKMGRWPEGLQTEDYAVLDAFVYAPDARLPRYTLHTKEQGQREVETYMISFKDITKVMCKGIQRNSHNLFKLLELSVFAREELRQKLIVYYGRVPEEDKAALSTVGA